MVAYIIHIFRPKKATTIMRIIALFYIYIDQSIFDKKNLKSQDCRIEKDI